MSLSTSELSFSAAQRCSRNLLAFYAEEEGSLDFHSNCDKCRCEKGDHRVSHVSPALSSRSDRVARTLAGLHSLLLSPLYSTSSLMLSNPLSSSLSPASTFSSSTSRPPLSLSSASSPSSSLSRSLSSVDGALSSSHKIDDDVDDDEENMDEEEKEAYTALDKKYDSDSEGDITPPEDLDDDEERGSENDDEPSYHQSDEDEDYKEDDDEEEVEEEEETPRSNVVVTNTLADIAIGDRGAKTKAKKHLSSAKNKKDDACTSSSSVAPKKLSSSSSSSKLVENKSLAEHGLPLPSTKKGQGEVKIGTSIPILKLSDKRVQHIKKVPTSHSDLLKFVNVTNGDIRMSVAFPTDFKEVKSYVFRGDIRLTGVDLGLISA